jgi:hypothetical protein
MEGAKDDDPRLIRPNAADAACAQEAEEEPSA